MKERARENESENVRVICKTKSFIGKKVRKLKRKSRRVRKQKARDRNRKSER